MNDWEPKTRLGRLVLEGKITSMSQALRSGLPLREPEIVDILLPELQDEVIDVRMVQRMTDSGRRTKFSVMVAVGNGDGFVGVGKTPPLEIGHRIGLAPDHVVEHPETKILQLGADPENIMITADNPEGAVRLQDMARRRQPGSGKLVIVGKAVEMQTSRHNHVQSHGYYSS